MSAPDLVRDLAAALHGWEIRLAALRPEGHIVHPILYRLSARDERTTQAIFTSHGDWCANPADSAPSLIRGLLTYGGLSDDEEAAVRALLSGGGL
jgi:hypothetical protein